MTPTVHLPDNPVMRLHITINDSAMKKLRKLAKDANCIGDTDREILQAYLHHLTGESAPQWGGARDGSGPKGRKAAKKK